MIDVRPSQLRFRPEFGLQLTLHIASTTRGLRHGEMLLVLSVGASACRVLTTDCVLYQAWNTEVELGTNDSELLE